MEVVNIVFQERLSERICEQDDVIKVSTISSEDRMLQLNQILDAEQTGDVPGFSFRTGFDCVWWSRISKIPSMSLFHNLRKGSQKLFQERSI